MQSSPSVNGVNELMSTSMDDVLTSDTKNGNLGAAATSAVDTLTTTAVTQTAAAAAAADVAAQSTPLVDSAVTAAAANMAAPAAANTAAPAAANTVPDAATTQSAAEDSKTLGSELHAKFIAAADLSYDTPSGPAKALSMQAFKKLVTSSSSAETQEWPQLSSKPKDEDLEAAFSLADTDGNKAVDEGEFVALLSLIRKGEVEGLGKKSFFGPDKKRQASFAGHLKLELPAAAAKAAAAKEAHEAAEAEAALKFAGLADFLKAEGLAWSLMAFVNAGKQTTESVVALDETALAARPFEMKPAHVIKIKRAGAAWKTAAAADVAAQSTPLVNSAVTAAAANTAAPAAAAAAAAAANTVPPAAEANTVAPAAAANTAAPAAAANTVPAAPAAANTVAPAASANTVAPAAAAAADTVAPAAADTVAPAAAVANTVPAAATTQSVVEDSKTLGSELHAKFIAAADLSYDTPSGPAKALSMQAFKKLVTSSSSAETQEWPQLSSKPKDEDLEAAFSLADTDGNKAVDEGEFVALLSLIKKGEVEGLGKKSFFGPDKKRQASFAGHLKLELPAAAAKAAAAKEVHEAAEAEAALKFAGLADFLKAEGLAWSLMAFVNAGKQTTESVVALDETALAARPFDMKPAHVIKIKRAGTIWKAAKQTVKNEKAAEAAAKARESEERLAAQSAAEASAATSSRTEEAAPSRKEESDNIFLFAFALFIVLCTLCYFVGTGTIDLGFDSAAAAKAAAVEKAEKAMAEAAASAKACKGLGKLLGKCKK